MGKGKRHKSKKYEEYYGEPYKPKGKRKEAKAASADRQAAPLSREHACPLLSHVDLNILA